MLVRDFTNATTSSKLISRDFSSVANYLQAANDYVYGAQKINMVLARIMTCVYICSIDDLHFMNSFNVMKKHGLS